MIYVYDIEKWKKEVKKGLVEMCILGLLNRRMMYGYEISKELESISNGILSVEEGTLYPLLRRLEVKGLIKGEWRIINNKARKYYTILPAGRALLREMIDFWNQVSKSIDNIFSGVNSDDE